MVSKYFWRKKELKFLRMDISTGFTNYSSENKVPSKV
jgi:hypothetical protein